MKMNIKTSKVSVKDGDNTDPKATETVKNKTEDELLSAELDLFLRGTKVPESELSEEDDEDNQDEEQIESDEDSPSEKDPSEVETDEDDPEPDKDKDHEEKPLDSRLEEFEGKFLPKEEKEQTLQDQLTEFHATLTQKAQAINNANFLEGLPKDGVFQKEGKTIYEMNGKELNDYILELQDAGRAFEAAQIQSNYFKAVEGAQRYQTEVQEYQELQQQYANAQQYVEWQDVKQEVTTHLPEITQDDFDKIGHFIDTEASRNPAYAAALTTKAGKLQKGVEAMQALGILQRLKDKASSAKITTPSAPDSRVEGKKVKSKQTGSKTHSKDPLSMSQAEFNKMSDDDLDAALMSEMDMMLGK
jgi:hypothetical protein